jgi:negative regulator of flagellin synthesis FlgM
MADIASISGASHARAAYQASATTRVNEAAGRAAQNARAAKQAQEENDLFEISDAARFLAKLRAMPDVRQELVTRVRDEIAQGKTDTPEKLDAAMDEMIDDHAI